MIRKIEKIGLSIIMLFALTMTTALAQPGGGGGGMGGGPGGMGGRPEGGMGMQEGAMPQIVEMAGYFTIDSEDVIKKVKIKDEATKTAVRKAIIKYTEGYETTSLKCANEIAAIKSVQSKLADSQSDRSGMRELMQGIQEQTAAVRAEMLPLHKELSETDMPALLDEKTAEKWAKYYSSLCQSKGFRLNQPQRRERGEGGEGGEGRQRPQSEE
ncbi:MAG: hypothetical protein SNG02_04015 [Rikenellaceae bacterium]